ncbi:prepilin-type N-terminal cleavage/methylation domain-containing protein [Thiomicrorhabdus aquaedulcis]|uniref:prepilin-type N-terminal cleavage/methylation domain-containing protein n=1 Tax=Thiomicrorhabdus aquaedulcis TaxID=2211106 RepID=UPI000FD83257|nr:prepilin-type N-terminal cleavage/methylation domain-containing protein [Thiomicrorhabdus aquaedulcis]
MNWVNVASAKVHRQRGFTLIELMVVVVIMAVVLSVGMLSLRPSDSAILNTQQGQLKSALRLVSDYAAFEQRLYLMAPTQDGLTTYVLTDQAWSVSSQVAFLPWQAGLSVEWNTDLTFAQQNQLPQAGWLFWPSGEVLPGEVKIQLDGQTQLTSNAKGGKVAGVTTVVWDGLLNFETSL